MTRQMVASGRRNANGIVRWVVALLTVVLSMTADAALRPAELVDVGYGYMQPETVNVVNGAQVFYKDIYQYFSEKYQTTDWMELEGLIPYGMWEGYVVTEVNTVLEDGDIANFKVPSRYYHQGQRVDDAPNWWEPVVGIDSDVMRGRAIRGLLLPDNLVFVGDRAFESCHELRYVGFGDTVSNLGERVFADCIALDHVHLPTNAWLGVAAFSNCVSLTDVTLPRYPTAIPDQCFMDCAALTRVALPNAIERIGASAFARTGLEKLTMPTNLVEIQDGAFLGCTNLSAVLFFENLSTIASNAFAGCSRLTKLVFLGKAPTVEGGALDGIPSNAIVYVTDHWNGPRDRWCGLEVRLYEETPSTVRFTWLDDVESRKVVVADTVCHPGFFCGELPAIPLRYVSAGYYYGPSYQNNWVDTSYYELPFETWRYLDGGLPTPFDIMASDTNVVSSSFAEGERKSVMFDLADVSGYYMDWGFSFYDTIENLCYKYGEYGGVSSSVEFWCDRLAALPDVWACEPASSIFVGWDMDFADIAQSPTNLSVHAVYRWKTAGESFNESGLSRYVLDAEALAVDGIVQFSGVIELDDPAAKLYDVGVRRYQTPERLFENLNLQLVGVSDDGRERKVLKTMPLEMVVYQMFHDYYSGIYSRSVDSYYYGYDYEIDPAVDRWVMQIPLSDIEGCEYFELQLVSGAMSYYWPYDEVVTGDVHVPEWSNTHLWASLVGCGTQAAVHEVADWDSDVPHRIQCGDILKVVGIDDLQLSISQYFSSDSSCQYARLQGRLGQWLYSDYEYGSDLQPVFYIQIPEADSWKWDDYYSGYGYDQSSFHDDWDDFYWDRGIWYDVRWDGVWSEDCGAARFQSEQISINTGIVNWPWYDYGWELAQFRILLPGTDIIYYDLGGYGRLTNSTPEYVVDRDGQKCLCDEGERPVFGDENLSQVVYWRLAAPKGIDWHGWWLDPIPVPDVSTNDDFQVAAGWSFAGWSKDPSEAVNNDVLIAQYEMTEYRLVYENTKGAQNLNPTNFTMVDAIEFAALPDIPGWTFRGWSPKSIKVGTIGDVTVTAEWEQISNAVVFVEGSHGRRCGGGELRQAVAWGECAQVPQIVADDGWRFVGWEGGDVAAPVKSAQAFVARYEAINYSLRFEGLKGATVDYPATFTVEDAIGFVPLADTEDFRFDGWMIGGEYVTGLASGSWGDKVVTAHWTPFVKLGEDGIRGWTGFYDGDEHTVSVSVAEPETYDVACTRLVSGRPVSAWSSEKNVCELMIRVVVSAAGYAPVCKDVSVVITPQSLTNCTLTASGTAEYINGPVTWSKRAYDPVAKMTVLERQDYTVSYRQTGDFSGAVTFTGKGNYTGTVTVPAEISITMPYETTGGTTWYYQTSGRTATLVRRGDAVVGSLSGAVVIPSSVNGLPVTEIADGAFANCSGVTAFVVPAGVAMLGHGVFSNCSSLKSVVFLGDAPDASRTFLDSPADLTIFAMPGSLGWGAPAHDVLPACWPLESDEELVRTIGWLPQVAITPSTGIRSGRVAVTMNYGGVSGIGREIRYTSDGAEPTGESTLYEKKFSLTVTEKMVVKAAAFCGGHRLGGIAVSTYLTSLEEVVVNEGSGAVALENDAAAPWTYDDTELGCDGRACLRSGAIGDNGTSSLTATFEGEGLLSFSWKTSCEYDDFGEFFFDHAECVLDGEVVAQADGETDWTDVDVPVSGKGVHTLVWRYVKDDADEDGATSEDCVWMGNVSFAFPAYVCFASEFGGGTGIDAIVSSSGHTVVLPEDEGDFQYPYHRIVGWRDGAVEYALGDTYVVTRPEVTLFAIWAEKHLPAPVIEVAAEYDDEFTWVGMSCGDGSHEIYYTLDGSEPTLESACYPGEPIAVTGTVTICAWSAEEDWYASAVTTARTVRSWTTLEDSLGCTGFDLKTGGDRNWIGSTAGRSVKSVALEAGETSWLTAEFEGVGVVTYELRDAGGDWTAEERWFETEGTHVLRWEGGELELRNLVFKPAAWVTFAANGGDGEVPAPICSAEGYSVSLPDCGELMKACHRFAGWMIAGEDAVWNPGASYAVTGSVEFVAAWTEKRLPTPRIELASSYATETTLCGIFADGSPDGTAIRYTLDGTEPTIDSALYAEPFAVAGSAVVTARAFCDDWFASACATAKTVRLPWTLAECVNWSNGEMSCGGAAQWTRDLEDTHDGVAALRSGKIGDEQETYLEAVMTGEGTLSFWWKASSETYRSKPMDYGVVMVDGNIRDDLMIFGETDWTFASVDVTGAGEHVVRWIYCKDEEDDPAAVGEDCIWLDEVSWVGNDQLQPAVVGDEGAVVTGDEEIGFVIRPSGTKTVVEVEIPAGLDAAKVTVEVTVAVTSLKSNGAKVKIVSGGADITEFLDLPSADGEGVIDLSRAAVRSEIVNEVLDPAKGAVIELMPDSPILTTANTRPGLVYTLHEGAALDGMTSGDSKVGDGESWTPEITVKGGNSAFYFISVGK